VKIQNASYTAVTVTVFAISASGVFNEGAAGQKSYSRRLGPAVAELMSRLVSRFNTVLLY